MNKQNLLYLIKSYEKPARKAFSIRYPFLKPIIIFARRIHRKITNMLNHKISRKKGAFFKCIIARHQSVLTRKLGDSNPNLQTRKIINLKRACENLDGLIIKPGETFSLWETIGKPKKSRGYVDGMLLSNGKITEGIGGGLCQLSNFLCWIFLHTNTKIIERYHHSMDTFPDSSRTLPFGSGATCLYNFIDLQLKNTDKYPLQIKIWLTEKHLKGQILSTSKSEFKFSIKEKNHIFIKKNNKFFRYNEIWKIKKLNGKTIKTEHMFTNFAPVIYDIPENYFQENNYKLIDLSNNS